MSLIAPGQACVFYSKNNNGYKVLGGGWIYKYYILFFFPHEKSQ